MINNSSIHKWDRLRQKQLDTQFINKLQAGMNCSMFEAKAILNAVYEVYQPFVGECIFPCGDWLPNQASRPFRVCVLLRQLAF